MAEKDTSKTVEQIRTSLADQIPYQWRVKTFYAEGADKSSLKAGRLPQGAKGQFLAYIDARDVFDRLDAVVGPDNWHDDFQVIDAQNHVVKVTLTVTIGNETISKSDVGYPNSDKDDEPFKSSVSDGIKRAGVHFGIGRFLYSLDPVWVEVDKWGKPLKPIATKAGTPPASPNAGKPATPQTGKTAKPPTSATSATAPNTKTFLDDDGREIQMVPCEIAGCTKGVSLAGYETNKRNHAGHTICKFHHDNGDWKAALAKGVNPDTGEIADDGVDPDMAAAADAAFQEMNNPQVTVNPDGSTTPVSL